MNILFPTTEKPSYQPFNEAFCEQFACAPERFEQELFWRGLFLHAKLFALLFWSRRETFFREDFDLIREIAFVSCPEIFISELNRFRGRNLRDKNWIRKTFSIRLSGKKLVKLKDKVWDDAA